MRASEFPVRRIRRWALSGIAALGLVFAVAAPAPAASPPPPPKPSVIGGSDASTDNYPWMVAVSYTPSVNDQYSGMFCGGVLAAPNKVVTAAHCAKGLKPSELKVVVGRTDLSDHASGKVVDVTGEWIHPDYYDPFNGSDVAVLTLGDRLDAPTLPIGTDADDLYRPGTPGTILGWGLTDDSAPRPTHLKQGSVQVTDDHTCDVEYPDFYPEQMVCAGSGTTRQCKGDSGGPLVVKGRLAGIVSFGRHPCTPVEVPGVLVRVSVYANDINKQLDN
ncbi:S1 family peptidase [Streptomyces violascens]|uniref:S1 family peptidase n=1 Tax=Streptomyces violascens TaxID=67381 RepID=UPI00367FC4E7